MRTNKKDITAPPIDSSESEEDEKPESKSKNAKEDDSESCSSNSKSEEEDDPNPKSKKKRITFEPRVKEYLRRSDKAKICRDNDPEWFGCDFDESEYYSPQKSLTLLKKPSICAYQLPTEEWENDEGDNKCSGCGCLYWGTEPVRCSGCEAVRIEALTRQERIRQDAIYDVQAYDPVLMSSHLLKVKHFHDGCTILCDGCSKSVCHKCAFAIKDDDAIPGELMICPVCVKHTKDPVFRAQARGRMVVEKYSKETSELEEKEKRCRQKIVELENKMREDGGESFPPTFIEHPNGQSYQSSTPNAITYYKHQQSVLSRILKQRNDDKSIFLKYNEMQKAMIDENGSITPLYEIKKD